METALACICTNKQFGYSACEFPITQKCKRSHMSSRKGKAAEAQPEAQIDCVEIHVPADEMIEILPGSLRFSCLFFSTNSLPSRSTPYMTSSARVFWKAKAEPHKGYCAVVHANNLLFQRAKGVGGIVTGFCIEDQGTDADTLNWLQVVDIAKKAKQPKKAKQAQKKKKKIASKTVALLKVGDLVEVTKPGHRALGRHGRIVDTSGGVKGPMWFKVQFDEKDDGEPDAKFRFSELAQSPSTTTTTTTRRRTRRTRTRTRTRTRRRRRRRRTTTTRTRTTTRTPARRRRPPRPCRCPPPLPPPPPPPRPAAPAGCAAR